MTDPLTSTDQSLTSVPVAPSVAADGDTKILKHAVDRLDKLERSTVVRINEWALTQEFEPVPLNALTAQSEAEPQVVLKATNVTTGEGEILVPPAATREWVAYIEARLDKLEEQVSSSLGSLGSRLSAVETSLGTNGGNKFNSTGLWKFAYEIESELP